MEVSLMNKSRNILGMKLPKCDVCGGITIYKGKNIGWKCVNKKCDTVRINKGGDIMAKCKGGRKGGRKSCR